MNDRDLERRLRDELRRHIGAPDAPPSLYSHVGRLGAGEPARAVDRRTSARALRAPQVRLGRFGRGARMFSTMAATVAIVALLAVGLAWRNSPAANPPASSSTEPTGTRADEPTQPVSVVPTMTASLVPTSVPTLTASPLSGLPVTMSYVNRLDALFAWAVTGSPGKLYVTTDGGRTWLDRTPADLAGKFQRALPADPKDSSGPHNIEFISQRDGWFSYEQYLGPDPQGDYTYAHFLYRTTDGGTTWARFGFAVPGANRLARIDRLDAEHAFAMLLGAPDARNQQLWATSDGGQNWSLSASTGPGANGSAQWPDSVEFTSTVEGWGEGQSAQPSLLHTVDGGRTWASSALPFKYGSSYGFGPDQYPFADAGQLITSAEVGIVNAPDGSQTSEDFVTWASTDGGAHWTVDSVTPLGDVVKLSNAGWPGAIVFMDRFTSRVRIFDMGTKTFTGTLDAGSFCGTGSGIDGSGIAAVSAISLMDAWVTCYHGETKSAPATQYVFATSDGGHTWRPLTEP